MALRLLSLVQLVHLAVAFEFDAGLRGTPRLLGGKLDQVPVARHGEFGPRDARAELR